MKNLKLLFFSLILSSSLLAQSPGKMSYQAVVRNASGNLMVNQATRFQIEIRRSSATGPFLYSEMHIPTTNNNGLATFQIGAGTNKTGIFGNINWENGPYYLVTKIDPTGGSSFSITGSQEILSVPFSLYAKEAATADYNSLTNKPNFDNFDTNKNDDFSGNYNDLSNKPWTLSGTTIYRTTGKLGLGTSSPSQMMEIKRGGNDNYLRINSGSTGSFNSGIMLYEPDVEFGWYLKMNAKDDKFYIAHKSGSGVTQFNGVMTMLPNGNVGIDEDAPSELLQVNGSVFASGGDLITSVVDGVINVGGSRDANSNVIGDNVSPSISLATGDEDLYIEDDLEVASQAYKPGGGSWTTISDRRLKKDISDYSDGLSQLMRIRPVWFTYNDKAKVFDQNKRHVGIIAQEMQAIAPYMIEEKALFQEVSEDEDQNEVILVEGQNYLTYDESALTYMMLNAIKEQQKLIEDLTKKIELLEKK